MKAGKTKKGNGASKRPNKYAEKVMINLPADDAMALLANLANKEVKERKQSNGQ